jgi:TetR/AcrR family transcriptional regulator, transcriptional repressor for nem operon
MTHDTQRLLLEQGMQMLLRQGYHNLGITAVLDATQVPKGSFYYHFRSKEDFGLQVIDLYMTEVHAGLDQCLGEPGVPPLQRVRSFFEATEQKYRSEGYLGCLLGGLGQELSGRQRGLPAQGRTVLHRDRRTNRRLSARSDRAR